VKGFIAGLRQSATTGATASEVGRGLAGNGACCSRESFDSLRRAGSPFTADSGRRGQMRQPALAVAPENWRTVRGTMKA